MPLKKRLLAFITPETVAPATGIEFFRERLLFYLLLVLGIFGAIAYLPSIYYGYLYRFYSVIVIDSLALGGVCFLLIKPGLSFNAKTLGLLAVFYVLGTWLLVALGPTGAGFMWLLLFSIMTGVLLGFRPALVSFGINLVTVAGLSILVVRQTIAWDLIHTDALAIWIVKGVNFICINAIMSVSTGFLITKISQMAQDEQGQRQELAREMQARLKAEKEKKELTDRLYQAQKMEAMGTLAGGVAHDFNNILSAIMGYAELSLMDPDLPESVRNNLDHVVQASERAKGISHQILTFSRHSTTHKLPCDLGLIAGECLDFFRISLSPDILLEREIPARPFPILADKNQISQVIMNLLFNSLQALDETATPGPSSGPGHCISLHLNWSSHADLPQGTSGQAPLLCLTVSDTGKGIAPDLIPRVFEPYFTTKKTGEGTGMGLSISHGIIREHGGDILVKSTPGQGAAFTVLLPAHGQVEPVSFPTEKAAAAGHESILLVDDDPGVLHVQEALLTSLGYRVISCLTPESALEKIQGHRDLDLVVTDRKMPGMTGVELRKRMLKQCPELPALLCTGFPHEADDALFDAVLVKPLAGMDLAAGIRQVLDSKKGD